MYYVHIIEYEATRFEHVTNKFRLWEARQRDSCGNKSDKGRDGPDHTIYTQS